MNEAVEPTPEAAPDAGSTRDATRGLGPLLALIGGIGAIALVRAIAKARSSNQRHATGVGNVQVPSGAGATAAGPAVLARQKMIQDTLDASAHELMRREAERQLRQQAERSHQVRLDETRADQNRWIDADRAHRNRDP